MAAIHPTPKSSRFQDLTGQRFDRWTVVAFAGGRGWLCRCDCGREKAVKGYTLTAGTSRSCGCLQVEVATRHVHLATAKATKHRAAETPEYRSWKSMKARCLNPKAEGYHNYGGRGIKVCGRWSDSFENFLADLGHRPTPQHTLDRIDANGDYEPANCRWATRREQACNRRDNVFLTVGDTSLTLEEWSRRSGASRLTIRGRLRRGWPAAQAVLPPFPSRRRPPSLLVLHGAAHVDR